MVVTILTGHVSMDTAYLVADYPYGRKVRCRIRYWLEHKPSKGYRFVSQTENPKTLQWNAPKASTYAEVAAQMFLDEEGHVRWDALTAYSDDKRKREYVERYPQDENILPLALAKVNFLRKRLAGKIGGTINGVVQEMKEWEKAEMEESLTYWEALLATKRPSKEA